MNPTCKSPTIRNLMDNLAGTSTQESISSNRCIPPPIGCGGPAHEFRDTLSLKEFTISGLCQSCQDKVFGQ